MELHIVSRKTLLLTLSALLTMAALGVAPASAVPADSAPISVIVQGEGNCDVAAAVQATGGAVTAEVSIIDAVVADIDPATLARLAEAPCVLQLTLDHAVETAGDRADVEFTKAIGVSEVWETGNLGEGVTVALLDTGLNPRLPALRSSPGRGGNGRILAYYDALSDQLYEPRRLNRSPGDPSGHGTHVAGIVGESTYERQDQEYRGVAPAANLVAVRVLDETGVGTYSDVLQGIEWVVQNKDVYQIRILNVSMYAPVTAPYWVDPLNLATMAAW